jgi:hypothetical protein
VREGDLLPLKIVRIERDRHRLGLSLRDARDDGERMGFRFSEAGEVLEVPEELRNEFEEREGVVVGGRGGRMPYQEESTEGGAPASDASDSPGPIADGGTSEPPVEADATAEAGETPAAEAAGSEDAPATMGEDADTRVSAGDALDTE